MPLSFMLFNFWVVGWVSMFFLSFVVQTRGSAGRQALCLPASVLPWRGVRQLAVGSVVVAAATHVRMVNRLLAVGQLSEGLALQVLLQHGFYTGVLDGLEFVRASAGKFKSSLGMGFREVQHPSAAPERLLWMRTAVHHLLDECPGFRANAFSPVQQIGFGHSGSQLVVLRHVLPQGGVPVLAVHPV